MARLTLTAAAFALTTAVSTLGPVATVAQANETGMASIHSWRKVGKKTCLVDHDHAGNGSGTNRQQAELAAIRAWTGFTDLEYGAAWANFNNAVGKQMRCGPGIGGIQCDLVATACRPW
jgi:hypothetical protein